MKLIFCVSFVFMFSCSGHSWRINNGNDCKVGVKMNQYESPSGDYVLKIPHNWKPFYQTTDSSNLVFEVDSELISDYDPINLVLFSVFTYDSKNFSDPQKEFDVSVKTLFKDYPEHEKIESGETDILGFHSFYIHTLEKKEKKPDYVDVFFQLRNDIDSNYCILQLSAPDNGKLAQSMCLLLEIAKSFKIIGKHN